MSDNQYVTAEELVPRLPNEVGTVGLDLEADSLYRHTEKICLLQVCFGDEVELLDPLEESEPLDALIDWLRGAKVWMHGADYDMTLMLRDWGFVPPVLFDTQIAAQLLGHQRFGYASLVEDYFEVTLSKSSQKADWGKRPLSPKMLEYACNDVKYLLPLASKVEEELRALDRYDWFLESCQASRERVIARESVEKESWRINGCGKLQPKGLHYLKSVWTWRDQEAARWNRPSFMVATNKQLLEWSHDLSIGRVVHPPEKLRPDRRKSLELAIEAAHGVAESAWPQRPKRLKRSQDPDFEADLKKLISERNKIAADLELDPSIIASRAVLEKIVGKIDSPKEILLNWQFKLLYG